jgi:hypothetical protein
MKLFLWPKGGRLSLSSYTQKAQSRDLSAKQLTSTLHTADAWKLLWRPGCPSTLALSATKAHVPNSCTMSTLSHPALFLPSVGSAVASFAAALRQCVANLADTHQIQSGQAIQELKRCILKAAVNELQILLREEQLRPQVRSHPMLQLMP